MVKLSIGTTVIDPQCHLKVIST